ncbi:hypothetical protein O3P69_001676 [Scylla paramamosain]|uniref:Uncharacterized protein n=1 Tax=Scylla paramamosain TaxID=85552 RepID=A0AAW0UZ17_SCYPA
MKVARDKSARRRENPKSNYDRTPASVYRRGATTLYTRIREVNNPKSEPSQPCNVRQTAMYVTLQRVITLPLSFIDPDEPFPDTQPPNALTGT